MATWDMVAASIEDVQPNNDPGTQRLMASSGDATDASKMREARPTIGIPASLLEVAERRYPAHGTGARNVDSVWDHAGGMPFIIGQDRWANLQPIHIIGGAIAKFFALRRVNFTVISEMILLHHNLIFAPLGS